MDNSADPAQPTPPPASSPAPPPAPVPPGIAPPLPPLSSEAETVAVPAARPPRVWPSLVIVPVVMVAVLLGQILLGISFGLIYAFTGTSGDIAAHMMSDPVFVVSMVMLNMVIIGVAAVLCGVLSTEKLAQRLGLVKPRHLWIMPLLIVGTPFIWASVLSAWPYVFAEPSSHLETLQEMLMSLAIANPLLLVVMIAVLPPIMEELLVRGYMQRRITRRLGPALGIGLATVAFSLLHMDPQHMVGVIPLSILCGFVAWRTGSVFPAMLCHAANNAMACIVLMLSARINAEMEASGEGETVIEMTAWEILSVDRTLFMLVTGACLLASIIILLCLPRHDRPTSEPQENEPQENEPRGYEPRP